MKSRLTLAILFSLAALLSACDSKPAKPTPEEAQKLMPANPALAQLYVHSCKACHAIEGSGAPLVHDHGAWDPRWEKSESVLLDHAIQGFQAMPAGGQCTACTAKDFQELTRFMADRGGGR